MPVKVSWLMTVYNGADYVGQAVKSVIDQTYDDWELVIIDDGSNDSSLEIAQSFNDPRIRISSNPANIGLTESLNVGLELCRGEMIARLDSDDLSFPTRLRTQVEALDSMPDLGAVGGNYYWCGRDGELLGRTDLFLNPEDIYEYLINQNLIGSSCGLIRKEAVETIGGWNPDFVMAQDYDFWLRLSESHKIRNLQQALAVIRISPGGLTCSRREEQERFRLMAREQACRRRNLDAPDDGFYPLKDRKPNLLPSRTELIRERNQLIGLDLKSTYLDASDQEPALHSLEDIFRRWTAELSELKIKSAAIFGIGEHTAELLKRADLSDIDLVGGFDNDPRKQGREICGLSVYPPEMIERLSPGAILISSAADEADIAEQLSSMDLKDVRIYRIYDGKFLDFQSWIEACMFLNYSQDVRTYEAKISDSSQ
ncbi:glycosyltransferase [candidate division KSB1 bacterium]